MCYLKNWLLLIIVTILPASVVLRDEFIAGVFKDRSEKVGGTSMRKRRRHFRVPTPLSRRAFFETALRHVNCARSPVWNSWRAAEILGGCVPLSPFVPRPFVRWVRSLSHRSAPVVEVDAKVGVLSREKGVPGACLAALPVLPVIPNFLASTRACCSRMTLPSPVSPVWYARHYSRANTPDPWSNSRSGRKKRNTNSSTKKFMHRCRGCSCVRDQVPRLSVAVSTRSFYRLPSELVCVYNC